ncbi:Isopentenyl phosphate kinase [uncultured archaeon]|nr:Isopentenyl phosphate kinase [uncultured archaeon]
MPRPRRETIFVRGRYKGYETGGVSKGLTSEQANEMEKRFQMNMAKLSGVFPEQKNTLVRVTEGAKMLFIVKLGGSVITEKKAGKFQVRAGKLRAIAKAIAAARKAQKFELIIVHGAGPFGHKMVADYGIADGVRTERQIEGFVATHDSMETLDKEVIGALLAEKIPAITVQPSVCIIQSNKKILNFDITFVKDLLKLGCVPVLYGDMVIDKSLGASVVSGDAIIAHLARELNADKVLLGSDVEGVFDSDPRKNKNAKLIPEISNANINSILASSASGSGATDVTQGMKGKLLELRENVRGKECFIFSLEKEKNLEDLLAGKKIKCTRVFFA